MLVSDHRGARARVVLTLRRASLILSGPLRETEARARGGKTAEVEQAAAAAVCTGGVTRIPEIPVPPGAADAQNEFSN